jgi:hypothetical protein
MRHAKLRRHANLLSCQNSAPPNPPATVSLEEQVRHDDQDADLGDRPTYRPYAGRGERIGGDVEDSAQHECPGADVCQMTGRVGRVHEEEGCNELREYLQQIAVSPDEATADADHFPGVIPRSGYPFSAKLPKGQHARYRKLDNREPDGRDESPEVRRHRRHLQLAAPLQVFVRD